VILLLKTKIFILVGRFIAIRGTVVRVSTVKPVVTQMSFICANCEQVSAITFSDGQFRPPTKCSSYGCKSRKFLPDRGVTRQTKIIDWQKIR